jgi:HSP20 family protein
MSTEAMEKKKEALVGRGDFWADFDRMRDAMNHWFMGFPAPFPRPAMARELLSQMASMPSLNMFTEGENLVVEADIPGFDKKDVEVSVNHNVLTIKAHRKQDKEEKKEGYYLQERQQGTLHRSVRLPMDVDSGKVQASSRDGVLRIEMPMAEPDKHKKITIDVK